jgi:hypothetical protein
MLPERKGVSNREIELNRYLSCFKTSLIQNFRGGVSNWMIDTSMHHLLDEDNMEILLSDVHGVEKKQVMVNVLVLEVPFKEIIALSNA